MSKAFIDRNMNRLLSRKLFVWISTTILLVADKLDGDAWLAISLAYIGSQGVADIAATWKNGRVSDKD